MNIEFHWESIGNNENTNRWTRRVRVIGGWLVKEEVYKGDVNSNAHDADDVIAVSMVFVSDPEHKWEIEK